MNESKVEAYGIKGKKMLTIKTDKEILTEFDDGQYIWKRPDHGRFLCKLKRTVNEIK